MSISDDKARMRKSAFAVRKVAHGAANGSPARARMLQHIQSIPALEVISGYMPIRTEIDPVPLLRLLSGLGYAVCLPVVAGPGRPLEFRLWTPDSPMIEGAFGAMIPEAREVVEPEFLIAPLLAFDAQGYRLGYGGGFYDRTLSALRARRRTYAVGFAYSAQEVDAVPRERTDQPLDAVITERDTVYPR